MSQSVCFAYLFGACQARSKRAAHRHRCPSRIQVLREFLGALEDEETARVKKAILQHFDIPCTSTSDAHFKQLPREHQVWVWCGEYIRVLWTIGPGEPVHCSSFGVHEKEACARARGRDCVQDFVGTLQWFLLLISFYG